MNCIFVTLNLNIFYLLIFFHAVLVDFDNCQRLGFAELYTKFNFTLNVYATGILLLTYDLKHSFASVLC